MTFVCVRGEEKSVSELCGFSGKFESLVEDFGKGLWSRPKKELLYIRIENG